MTNPAPQGNAPNNTLNCPLLDLSAFSMEREIMNSFRPRPAFAPSRTDSFPPACLSLPVLAPRAIKHTRRAQRETSDSHSLMSFVSHLSLNDVSSLASTYSSSDRHKKPALSPSGNAPDLEDEATVEKSVADLAAFAMEVADEAVQHLQATPSSQQFSMTTPEPTKTVISTPQAIRPFCQKRKSPFVQSTPVNGNRPLARLPSLDENMPSSNTTNQCPYQRCLKKPKNYQNLMSNAPLLPASPDLEDRNLAVPRYHAPCFSPPVGGVTLVNPNFRPPLSTPVLTPVPRRALPLMAAAAAGLPSLDETERSAPKWLRMKKRDSLLYALRIAAAETY